MGLRDASVHRAVVRGQASSYLMDGPGSEPPPRPRGSRSLEFEATSSSSCGDCPENLPRFPALPSLLAPAASAESQPPTCTRRLLRGSGLSLPSSPNLLRSRLVVIPLRVKRPCKRAFFLVRNAPLHHSTMSTSWIRPFMVKMSHCETTGSETTSKTVRNGCLLWVRVYPQPQVRCRVLRHPRRPCGLERARRQRHRPCYVAQLRAVHIRTCGVG